MKQIITLGSAAFTKENRNRPLCPERERERERMSVRDAYRAFKLCNDII